MSAMMHISYGGQTIDLDNPYIADSSYVHTSFPCIAVPLGQYGTLLFDYGINSDVSVSFLQRCQIYEGGYTFLPPTPYTGPIVRNEVYTQDFMNGVPSLRMGNRYAIGFTWVGDYEGGSPPPNTAMIVDTHGTTRETIFQLTPIPFVLVTDALEDWVSKGGPAWCYNWLNALPLEVKRDFCDNPGLFWTNLNYTQETP